MIGKRSASSGMPWFRAASWSSSRLMPSTGASLLSRCRDHTLGRREHELGVGLLDHHRVVRGADDRSAGLARQRREQRREREGVRLIQAGCRLVDQQQARPGRQRPRDRDPNLLARREPRDALAGPLGEARPPRAPRVLARRREPADRLGRARRSRARSGTGRGRVCCAHERDVSRRRSSARPARSSALHRRRRTSRPRPRPAARARRAGGAAWSCPSPRARSRP